MVLIFREFRNKAILECPCKSLTTIKMQNAYAIRDV